MDHRKEPLDLEIGDTIIWRGEGMRIEEGVILLAPGVKGTVVTRSEHLLADAATKAGPISAGPWALVEFENGFRVVLDSRARFERVKDQ